MIQKIPIRFDYYQYAIETWAEIFKEIDFGNIKTIIDLCMGWAPKIELALTKTNFTGKLLAIDNSKGNMKILLSLVNQFELKYSIKTKHLDILKPVKGIKTDILVANHIIDDLFLYLYLGTEEKVYKLFSQPQNLENTWMKITADKTICKKIYDGFKDFILKKIVDDGLLIIAQYAGYQERLYNLDFASKFCKDFLQNLTTDLTNNYGFIRLEQSIIRSFKYLKNPYFQMNEIYILKKKPI